MGREEPGSGNLALHVALKYVAGAKGVGGADSEEGNVGYGTEFFDSGQRPWLCQIGVAATIYPKRFIAGFSRIVFSWDTFIWWHGLLAFTVGMIFRNLQV